MSESNLTKFLLLPKLELIDFNNKTNSILYFCKTRSKSIWCHHCGLECFKVHDRRIITIKDAPHGLKPKVLIIK